MRRCARRGPVAEVVDRVLVVKSERQALPGARQRGRSHATASSSAARRSATRSSRATAARRRASTCSASATRPAASTGRSAFPTPAPSIYAEARKYGDRPGGLVMIHGQPVRGHTATPASAMEDWTEGCIAVSNAEMDEIWAATDDRHADRDLCLDGATASRRSAACVSQCTSRLISHATHLKPRSGAAQPAPYVHPILKRITAEGNMKITFGKILPAVLLASTFAVGACASSSEVDDLKASVSSLQRDVVGPEDRHGCGTRRVVEGCAGSPRRRRRRSAGRCGGQVGRQCRQRRVREVGPDVPEVAAQVADFRSRPQLGRHAAPGSGRALRPENHVLRTRPRTEPRPDAAATPLPRSAGISVISLHPDGRASGR